MIVGIDIEEHGNGFINVIVSQVYEFETRVSGNNV